MLAQFASLLAKFLEQTFHVRPVETDLRRARTELVGLKQRRHRRRDSRQNRWRCLPFRAAVSGALSLRLLHTLFSFLDFQRLPVAFDVGRGFRFRIAKYMRMPVHQLDRKSTRLNSSHLGISYAVF